MKHGILIPLILIITNFASCQKAQTSGIKIMTFNIRYGTAADGENSWEYRKSILINCLKKYQPDILGVQESHDYQVDFIKSAFPNWEALGVGRYHTVAEPDRPQESMKGESCTIFYDNTKAMNIFWRTNTDRKSCAFQFPKPATVPSIKTRGSSFPSGCRRETRGSRASRIAPPTTRSMP